MNVSTAINGASRTLAPREKTIDEAGPGDQSYDLAPKLPIDEEGRDALRKLPNTATLKNFTLAFVAVSFSMGVLAGASLKQLLIGPAL